ncbi:hypothetical protein [Ruminococcus sp.]|uniref:hypothetical protein n=1 Tax=Ruminococcus sp. TaxID=41978 RepID=UPI001B52B76C|nr:hypothetical protein [Ruminococcus sp.]MBP5431239.1 hypothetical protein [Ruminococcus sp.]
MYIARGKYSEAKQITERIIEKDCDNISISHSILAHEYYDFVECGTDEEDSIISNILFQNTVVKYINKIYYLPSLLKDFEKIEQGFKFERIQLSDEEYADLKNIINRLKEFIKENDSKGE